MEQLKDKLFAVLAGSIEALDFEKWLYEQQELMEVIESNAFVYQVVCLNYKHLTILKSVDKICESIGDEEAYLVSKLERGCREILKTKEPNETLDIINSVGAYYDYESDYNLLQEFYFFEDVLVINNNYKDYGDKEMLIYASKIAASVLLELDTLSLNEKRQVLYAELKEDIGPTRKQASNTKWYNFLKKGRKRKT